MKHLIAGLVILALAYMAFIEVSQLVQSTTAAVNQAAAQRIAAARAREAEAAAAKAEAAAAEAEAEASAHAAWLQAQANQAAPRAAWQTVLIAGLVLVALSLVAALAWAAVDAARVRARLVYPDGTGLYPAVIAGHPVTPTSLNEPGAQIARIAPAQMRYAVLPAPDQADTLPTVPAPKIIDASRLEHLERLFLAAPGGEHDNPES